MSSHSHDLQALCEEALEELWTAAEADRPLDNARLAAALQERVEADWAVVVGELERTGLAAHANGRITLTAAGSDAARIVVRRHRLAELLLTEVLEVPRELVEADACRMEHALSPAATEAVCSFLGHPPACPHGLPIPPGECCARRSQRLRPLLRRLTELAPGEVGTVVLVTPADGEGLEQLTDLGVTPGARVTLRQHRPSLVVEVERTLLGLEDEVARRIHVRPVAE